MDVWDRIRRGYEREIDALAKLNDIARMAAFLASNEADYLTGLSISVSGGSEMH